MLKFKLTYDDGTPGLGFGLSAENIRLLQANKPILINLREMGMEGRILIFYRETETELVDYARAHIDGNTIVRPMNDNHQSEGSEDV